MIVQYPVVYTAVLVWIRLTAIAVSALLVCRVVRVDELLGKTVCQYGVLMSIPQCIILEIPVNDSINNFDRVFLEIPVKTCIVGMLLTCPISFETTRAVILSHVNSMICCWLTEGVDCAENMEICDQVVKADFH